MCLRENVWLFSQVCYLAKQGPDVLTDVRADGTQQESLHL